MGNLELLNLLIGLVLPLLIGLVQKDKWSSSVKTAVSIGFCIVVGAATAYFGGQFTGKQTLESIALVIVSTQTAYRNIWLPALYNNHKPSDQNAVTE